MEYNNIVEMLCKPAEDHQKACEAALAQSAPTIDLRANAAEFVPSGVHSPPLSEASFRDDEPTSYYEYVGYSLPYTPPTPPSLRSDAEDSGRTSASSESVSASAFASIDYSRAMHGSDIREWPAADRTALNPSTTLTLRFRTTRGTHNIPVPKLPFIAVSPRIRAALSSDPELERITLFSSNLTPGAIRRMSRWLNSICKTAEAGDVRIPNTSLSWRSALELRMTAMELGMEQYVQHVSAEYLRSLVGRELDFDEARVLVKTARVKDDGLLVGFTNCLAYLVRYHELEKWGEAELAKHLSCAEWISLLEAVQEEGVKVIRRKALGLE
ncbi:hypothetical protein EKO04_011174 [Ascochyta lentis]|uniref:Uncharacterized protein n=1 Tax=Ascochyta lentis TaxID=205686 RepID=A0A8H7IVL4_9PLEO|nr:hypothetical protein EKO04_011174 [Ascochyta lentis]